MAMFGADPLARRMLDPNHQIAHWSEFERGGHFPAMEVPDLLVGDLRAFFRQFREVRRNMRPCYGSMISFGAWDGLLSAE